MSQSLPLFRAFQLVVDEEGNYYVDSESQSLPLFRAFQHIVLTPHALYRAEGRNPFLYSGHFNLIPSDDTDKGYAWVVAIPSFIQGISTRRGGRNNLPFKRCRNPFFYSGHFNRRTGFGSTTGGMTSQSLLLFRAFQRAMADNIESTLARRNPFFYSGHFNMACRGGEKLLFKLSQSLLLFRAFQLGNTCGYRHYWEDVAIPSFIQGISTKLKTGAE